jgi:uncharacterized membrane protein YfcA
VALGVHLKNKLVSFDKVLYLLLPALVTTVLSSIFATNLGGEVLTKLFGGFLTATALGSFLALIFKKN